MLTNCVYRIKCVYFYRTKRGCKIQFLMFTNRTATKTIMYSLHWLNYIMIINLYEYVDWAGLLFLTLQRTVIYEIDKSTTSTREKSVRGGKEVLYVCDSCTYCIYFVGVYFLPFLYFNHDVIQLCYWNNKKKKAILLLFSNFKYFICYSFIYYHRLFCLGFGFVWFFFLHDRRLIWQSVTILLNPFFCHLVIVLFRVFFFRIIIWNPLIDIRLDLVSVK